MSSFLFLRVDLEPICFFSSSMPVLGMGKDFRSHVMKWIGCNLVMVSVTPNMGCNLVSANKQYSPASSCWATVGY